MKAKDKKELQELEKSAKDAAKILRKHGHDMIADRLLLSSGYAVGLAHRLDEERQRIEDHIAGCLV